MSRGRRLAIALHVTLLCGGTLWAADADDAQKLFRTGKYAECIDLCKTKIDRGDWAEGWWVNKIRAELTTGQYADALKTYEEAIVRQPWGIQVRLLGRTILQQNNRPDDAARIPGTIVEMVVDSPWRFGASADRATLARALVLAGEDPRRVLEQILDRAKKDNADAPEPYIASGDLALEKNDLALASEAFESAAKKSPDDPDIFLGLAKAYTDDAPRATTALGKALTINPRHVESLLFQADNLIDREAYEEASAALQQVLDINPHESHAWAYRAVLAHLEGDSSREKAARAEALSTWQSNPEVDHLIGLKLSHKYRFAEGKAYQQQSLAMSPAYRPAKVQLCQDLLRLGEDEAGWQLAAKVFEEDPYNVLAFNLTTLRDHLAKFRILKDAHFTVRMDPREADIYGSRVMTLLNRAREALSRKYAVDLPEKVFVEIFPQQKDFAIRTFGLPGGAGFLGVCFGNVITANSPASRMARPANWEAILWHEFCHSITLNKTHNKMPRWLSEGISVYEELQENPTWGQTMNPQYREIILSGGTTPVSKLSGAFLRPAGPLQLQFAYYESSMVVRYVVDQFGLPALRAVLTDLGNNIKINDALARNTEPMDALDANFEEWFKAQATALASDADLSRDNLPLDANSTVLAEWNRQYPKNVWGLLAQGQALVAERKWQAALEPLQQAAALYPTYAQPGGPYVLLAAAYKGLNDPKSERAMLQKHVALSADAVEARLRLLEISSTEKDWPAVKKVAEEVIAINPLTPAPHRYLAQACEALANRPAAIEARKAMLLMDPLDLSGQHYALAKLLAEEKQLGPAKLEVLKSLEETPRFRNAHRLLLEIVDRERPADGGRTP